MLFRLENGIIIQQFIHFILVHSVYSGNIYHHVPGTVLGLWNSVGDQKQVCSHQQKKKEKWTQIHNRSIDETAIKKKKAALDRVRGLY